MPILRVVFERFAAAVRLLALSGESLQQRLADAFIQGRLILLTETDLPDQFQERFSELKNGLSDHGRKRMDQVIREITEKQAEHYIQIILDLHSGIAKEVFRHRGSVRRNEAND